MAETPFILVPKVLREHLGEEGAKALVDMLNQFSLHEGREFRASLEAALSNLASKLYQDIRELENALRTEMREGLAAPRTAMEQGHATIRAEMERGYSATRM